MNRTATQSNLGASASSRQYRYAKVLDNRKHAIRGFWKRNRKFLARITVEDDAGRKRAFEQRTRAGAGGEDELWPDDCDAATSGNGLTAGG